MSYVGLPGFWKHIHCCINDVFISLIQITRSEIIRPYGVLFNFTRNTKPWLSSLLHLCVYLACMCRGAHMLWHLWKSEDNLGELALSIHHEGSGDPSPVVRPGGKHLYPLSHLTDPLNCFCKAAVLFT